MDPKYLSLISEYVSKFPGAIDFFSTILFYDPRELPVSFESQNTCKIYWNGINRHKFRLRVPDTEIKIFFSCTKKGNYKICVSKDSQNIRDYDNDANFFDTVDDFKIELDRIITCATKTKLTGNYYAVLRDPEFL